MSFVYSYSFLNDFENCPRKAWHRYIAKDLPREAKSQAQTWGIDVHKALDAAVNGAELPGNMVQYTPLVASVKLAGKDKKVQTEQQLAITADGSPAGGWDKDVWLKGRLDVFLYADTIGMVLDWKTGKKREDPFELEVFGLLAKCKYPGLTKIVGAYVWLQENKVGKIHDLSNFAGTFGSIKATTRTVDMLPKDKEWDANPNPLCGWCPVKKCEYNRS